MKRLTVSVLVFVITLSLYGLVFAQETPDATLNLTEGQVAVGIGWSWGDGVLTLKEKDYPFKVSGLSVGEVGITEAKADGEVYHLKRLSDFNGTYIGVKAEGTAGMGAGSAKLQNEHGVLIQLRSKTKGVNFAVAPGGVKLTLQK
jgi:hypothetical protein